MNNKGFTLVELVISVVLVMAIIIPAFAIALSYKNKMQIASDKQALVSFKNRITTLVETDILKYGLNSMTWYDTSGNADNGRNNCNTNGICIIKLEFNKPLTEETDKTRYFIIYPANKRIIYSKTPDTSDTLFDEILAANYADILDYHEVAISFSRTYIDIDSADTSTQSLYYATLFVPIKYVDDTNTEETLDYGIHIIAELHQTP